MMQSAPRRSASPRATASAVARLGATTMPGAANARSRLTTMVVRPASGLPIDRKVLRPITTGLPMVTARKCAMSDLSRHGSPLSRPITPFSARAATRVMETINSSFRGGASVPEPGIHVRQRCGPVSELPPAIVIMGFRTRSFGAPRNDGFDLHRHSRLDVRVRLIALERKILVVETEQVLDRRIELHGRQRSRAACQLQSRVLQMIE